MHRFFWPHILLSSSLCVGSRSKVLRWPGTQWLIIQTKYKYWGLRERNLRNTLTFKFVCMPQTSNFTHTPTCMPVTLLRRPSVSPGFIRRFLHLGTASLFVFLLWRNVVLSMGFISSITQLGWFRGFVISFFLFFCAECRYIPASYDFISAIRTGARRWCDSNPGRIRFRYHVRALTRRVASQLAVCSASHFIFIFRGHQLPTRSYATSFPFRIPSKCWSWKFCT
jgi:hypothetical protein